MSVWTRKQTTYVIAEAGLNHNGEIGLARELVHIAARSGADAVKFQKRDVASLATTITLDAPDGRFPSLGKTYREIRERHELSLGEFEELRDLSDNLGLDFFVTPFDIPSVDFLEKLGVDRYKIASHGVTNLPLLRRVADTTKPVLLSTGMSTMQEVEQAINLLELGSRDLAILHCVSSYPTQPDEARLDLIATYRRLFDLPVGYSGHEIGFLPTLIAVSQGAKLVERHITVDNNLEGFDHHLSLTESELTQMIEKIRQVESMFGDGAKEVTEKETITRLKYQVSIVSARQIELGEVLSEGDVVFKNPGTGLPPRQLDELVGKKALFKIDSDTILTREMFG